MTKKRSKLFMNFITTIMTLLQAATGGRLLRNSGPVAGPVVTTTLSLPDTDGADQIAKAVDKAYQDVQKSSENEKVFEEQAEALKDYLDGTNRLAEAEKENLEAKIALEDSQKPESAYIDDRRDQLKKRASEEAPDKDRTE